MSMEICLGARVALEARLPRAMAHTAIRADTPDTLIRLGGDGPPHTNSWQHSGVAPSLDDRLAVPSLRSHFAARVAISLLLLLLLVAIAIAPAAAQTTYLADWGSPDTVGARLASTNLAPPLATGPALSRMTEAQALPLLLTAARLKLPATPDVGRTAAQSVDLVFGAGRGTRLLTLLTRYGYNAAGGVREGRGFTIVELDSLLAAFADLPSSFIASLNARNRALAFEGKFEHSAAANQNLSDNRIVIAFSARTGIHLGDHWAKASPQFQRLAMLHELAHDFIRTNGGKIGWRAYWENAVAYEDARASRLGLASSRVSTYAKSALEEDFAECVVAYRFAPRILKQLAPQRYQFLRERVFKGQEYLKNLPTAH